MNTNEELSRNAANERARLIAKGVITPSGTMRPTPIRRSYQMTPDQLFAHGFPEAARARHAEMSYELELLKEQSS